MNQQKNVKHQYSDDKNLSARIKLHAKHSTNRKGFYPWLFELIKLADNDSILELGCGNGMLWKGKTSKLPVGSRLILSDFSEGMLNAAKENLSSMQSNIDFQQIDIQNIPYTNAFFDTIIANHMLYHIPNLDNALSEVRRVLKKNGRFYASTLSNGGIRQYLHDAIKKFVPDTCAFSQEISFNMENGSKILGQYFSSVERHDYIDSLAITDTKDLMGWLDSSMSVSDHSKEKERLSYLYEYFEKIRIKEGSINIPNETCLFVCTI